VLHSNNTNLQLMVSALASVQALDLAQAQVPEMELVVLAVPGSVLALEQELGQALVHRCNRK